MALRIVCLVSFLNGYVPSLQLFSELGYNCVSVHLCFLDSEAACVNECLQHFHITDLVSFLFNLRNFLERLLFLFHALPHKLVLLSLDWDAQSLDTSLELNLAKSCRLVDIKHAVKLKEGKILRLKESVDLSEK